MNVLYDAVAYPLRKHGWQIIVVSTIVWLLMALTLALPLINLGLFVLYASYFGAYYLNILSETVNGNDVMPNWPDFMSVVDDILKPALRLVVIVALTWLPFICVVVIHTRVIHVPRIVGLVALVYGVFSFPMPRCSCKYQGAIGRGCHTSCCRRWLSWGGGMRSLRSHVVWLCWRGCICRNCCLDAAWLARCSMSHF